MSSLVFGIAGVIVAFPLFFAIYMIGSLVKEKGRHLVLTLLTSAALGGVCIRIGFWLIKELSIEPVVSFPKWEISMPAIEPAYSFVLPMLGWIDIAGGVLIIIGGTLAAILAHRKTKAD